MTRPDLDAIRARCDAASGPTWTWEINDATTPVRSDVSRIVSMDAMRDRQQSGIKTSARLPYLATVYNRADTEFIAHARTDIPALLAYVEELEGRTSYTVGETEWANRIANAEERALTAEERLEQCEHELEQQARVWEQAMAEAQTDVRELRARIAELEAMR